MNISKVFILFISLSFIASANAEILCAKNKVKISKLKKFNLSKNIIKATDSCPTGYSTIANMSMFKGANGETGVSGVNGTDGLDGTTPLISSSCNKVESQRTTNFTSSGSLELPSNFTASCASNQFILNAIYWGSETYSLDFSMCRPDAEDESDCLTSGSSNEFKSLAILKSESIFDANKVFVIGIIKPYGKFPANIPDSYVFNAGSATITENLTLTCCDLGT